MSAEQPLESYFDEPLFDPSGVYALTYDESSGKYHLSIDGAKLRNEQDEVKDYGRSFGTPAESSDRAQ